MTIVTLTEEPAMGKRERVCHICDETYVGWNLVACPLCERSHDIEIVRTY